MRPCQEKMLASQSTTVTAFQHSRVDLTSTISDLKCAPSLLLAADAACSYTFLIWKSTPSLERVYDDMDFEAEIRALARRNVSAADSGVMSRCGPPSSSNPTINLRIIADRSKGG
jgi:hypothetical protein